MFLSFKALEQSGVKVQLKKSGVELIPECHWPEESIELFNRFIDSMPLDVKDADEVSEYICSMTLLKTIKGCLT